MEKNDELTTFQKGLLLSGVFIVFIIVLVVIGLVSDDSNTGYNCDTLYNPTACPEPDYDSDLYEQLKEYPDDSY